MPLSAALLSFNCLVRSDNGPLRVPLRALYVLDRGTERVLEFLQFRVRGFAWISGLRNGAENQGQIANSTCYLHLATNLRENIPTLCDELKTPARQGKPSPDTKFPKPRKSKTENRNPESLQPGILTAQGLGVKLPGLTISEFQQSLSFLQ